MTDYFYENNSMERPPYRECKSVKSKKKRMDNSMEKVIKDMKVQALQAINMQRVSNTPNKGGKVKAQ